ncbi:hypothetical protein C8R32_102160 [Nitrosospira sp. Nsp5]|uniref:Ribbon-helix-helix protein CopG domain-containing protein n=1 Tax=Nitrosospira multiformis TaxID=1231 RepID=A0ABY0TKM9_9PROT|nr:MULTISPECIES: ribbon-helix-helix protein, CopG family [Nitrosospira]PTR10071.1 hypothetical protein C8R32_102160 [Nitrosospira sp. Nsp5]SDQ98074.1 hypothetical protein SAMN05216402_3098 [Nitrosospira multiformis]
MAITHSLPGEFLSEAAEAKKERLIFEVNPEALKLFDELRVRTGASTRSELFRNLLKFASASVDDLEEGYIPLLKDKEGNLLKSTGHKFLVWR